MKHEELQRRVNSLSWHHQIDLGDGLITPGGDKSEEKLNSLGLPKNMRGLRVLDIGAYDGFFSFACEKRGAQVVASDHFCWGGKIATKATFDLAKEALESKVAERFIKVEDISPESMNGFFDIVLFLGVLYHATDPLGYLCRVRSVTKTGGFAVIETHVDMMHETRPVLAYYPAGALCGDASNYFGPNAPAVIGMCQDAGFARTEVIGPLKDMPTRWVFHAYA